MKCEWEHGEHCDYYKDGQCECEEPCQQGVDSEHNTEIE
jgi:hypothetical protein